MTKSSVQRAEKNGLFSVNYAHVVNQMHRQVVRSLKVGIINKTKKYA